MGWLWQNYCREEADSNSIIDARDTFFAGPLSNKLHKNTAILILYCSQLRMIDGMNAHVLWSREIIYVERIQWHPKLAKHYIAQGTSCYLLKSSPA